MKIKFIIMVSGGLGYIDVDNSWIFFDTENEYYDYLKTHFS